MRADIVPGAVFPDYELADHRGKHRTLSELQQGDPLVLVLSRGGFCPKERRQHEGLVELHREMTVGYCRLVTISTDCSKLFGRANGSLRRNSRRMRRRNRSLSGWKARAIELISKQGVVHDARETSRV